MSITEAERHEIYELIKQATNDRIANNAMTMFPPVGWADVATKSDLHVLEVSVRAEIVRLEGRLERELRAGQSRYVTWLLASQAAIVGVVGVATSVLIVVLR